MKRILVFANSFNVGGVTSVIKSIYNNLDNRHFKMDFARKNWNKNEFDERVFADGNQVFYYNDCPLNKIPILNYKMQQINIAKQVLKQIRGIRYDAIHIHANPIIGLYIGKKANIPVRIMHAHEAIPDFGDNINKSWVTRAIWRHRQKKYNQWATVKAGDSLKACKVKFGENVVDDPKVCVLYPPVDMIKFNPATYGEETEVEKSINTSAFNMIHVGRLNPVKNQAFLIDILSEMNKIRESDLYIIGNGEQKDALLSYARLKGVESKFHLLPPDASPAIYRKMNCSLLPSFSEAFGMVAVESQLMGVPCFASTNVPNDVDIGMCQFIDLSKGAEEWAKQIYSFDYINACVSPNKKNAFTVQNLLEKLEEKYSE